MLKKLLLLALVALVPCYSYSDSISPYYGYTGNAAANGMTWSMDGVLPEPPGLDINTVIYSYTPIKDPNDPFTVTVQNENAIDGGYIFRSTDDWSGHPGGIELRRVIGVGAIPRAYWGDGSIETTGFGTVTNPNVVYTYKVDPCFDPQFDPNCPGYQTPLPPPPPKVEVETVDVTTLYDATEGDAEITEVDEEIIEVEEKEELSDEEKEKRKKKMLAKSKDRLEKALAAADNSAFFAEAIASAQMLDQMNAVVNINTYVAASIDGGTYRETVVLDGGNIPDNKNGRRLNFSSQILHDKMVDMQYNR